MGTYYASTSAFCCVADAHHDNNPLNTPDNVMMIHDNHIAGHDNDDVFITCIPGHPGLLGFVRHIYFVRRAVCFR